MSCRQLFPFLRANRLLAAPGVLAALHLALAPIAAAQGAVLVVDGAGGPQADFTSVKEAVEWAQDGDTVLVREGEYSAPSFYIHGKSLVVTAESDARVVIRSYFYPPLSITGLAAHQEVLLRGLTFEYDQSYNGLISSNAGSVRLEDCVLLGFGGHPGPSQLLHVFDTASLVLTRCELSWERVHVPVLLVENSGLSCYDTRIQAATAPSSDVDGATALQAKGSRLFLSGGWLQGGNGGDGLVSSGGCLPGRDGGDALIATDCDVFLRGTVLAGGTPGVAVDSACTAGQPGESFVLTGGTFAVQDGPPPRLDASPLLREGHFMRLTFDAPGKQAFALFSETAAAVPVLPLGELLVSNPLVMSFSGAIPVHGKTVQLPIATLPAGIEATYHLQGAFLDPATTEVTLGNATAVTLLAAGL